MKRGRKSSSSLVTRPVLAFTRKLPDPPASLTAPEGEVWKTIVASPAGNWIDASNYALLIEFCRVCASADVIAQQVHAFDPQWLTADGGLERFDRLLRMQDRAAGRIASLSGKLRLSPSTRVHKSVAGRIVADSTADYPEPWNFTGEK